MCQRYPSPDFTLDVVISNRRLLAFVNEMLEQVADEKIYDVWLHRIHDKSFDEFKSAVYSTAEAAGTTEEQTANIIENSFDILNNFSPI